MQSDGELRRPRQQGPGGAGEEVQVDDQELLDCFTEHPDRLYNLARGQGYGR